LTSAREGNRGDVVGEGSGGGEGDEMSSGTTTGEFDGTGVAFCLSSRSEDVTRAMALLIIWMISSSVSRSSTNTLQ
jgi:hypothetical protein